MQHPKSLKLIYSLICAGIAALLAVAFNFSLPAILLVAVLALIISAAVQSDDPFPPCV